MAKDTGTDNIDIAPENDNFDAVDVQTNDDDTGDTTGQGNIPAAPAAVGPASFNLRVEQNKIPEFFGAKSKDTISAADYIRRLEDLAKTNRWTDAQTYHHFANSLRNPAREWLSSIVDWNTDDNVRLLWSDFKDLFKQEYAVQTNDKLILEGLSNLAMKPNETTNELIAHPHHPDHKSHQGKLRRIRCQNSIPPQRRQWRNLKCGFPEISETV